MKKRLKEIEEEAGALREMQAKVEKEMGSAQEDPSDFCLRWSEKKRLNDLLVDYACTPEEVQQHFQSCGTVNRVTILTDKFGQPKGFAYVEFVELESVQNSLLLNESELHGRQLKVAAKRTNVPGLKQFRARGPRPYGFRSRRPYMPGPPMFPPYGYGIAAKFCQFLGALEESSMLFNCVDFFLQLPLIADKNLRTRHPVSKPVLATVELGSGYLYELIPSVVKIARRCLGGRPPPSDISVLTAIYRFLGEGFQGPGGLCGTGRIDDSRDQGWNQCSLVDDFISPNVVTKDLKQDDID
ncbi:polyadenylate-binding protein 2-like protein [Tanacetum coccineum]